MCWVFPDMGHIGEFSSYSSHIWPCCSLQNRPAAVQRSPHNGPSSPCMNPALTNTSWVREWRRRRDGVFPDLVFFLLPFCVTVAFTDMLAHVTSHRVTYSPQFQLHYLKKSFIFVMLTLYKSNPLPHIPIMSFIIIILTVTFIYWAFCCRNIDFKY